MDGVEGRNTRNKFHETGSRTLCFPVGDTHPQIFFLLKPRTVSSESKSRFKMLGEGEGVVRVPGRLDVVTPGGTKFFERRLLLISRWRNFMRALPPFPWDRF